MRQDQFTRLSARTIAGDVHSGRLTAAAALRDA